MTWLVLLFSRGAFAAAGSVGRSFGRVAFFFAGSSAGATSGVCGATSLAAVAGSHSSCASVIDVSVSALAGW
jgi:hypothetical protein